MDVIEARDSEYKAWAHVQNLKSSLDEQTLELQVKISIGAEAISHVQLFYGKSPGFQIS